MSNFLLKQMIFRIMKISLIQLIIVTLLVSISYANSSYGQEKLNELATISIKNGSLKSVLQAIEKQVDVDFSYKKEVLNATEKINIELKNETVTEILETVLTPHNISFQVLRNNQIVLTKNENLGKVEHQLKEPINEYKIEEAITVITIKGTVTDEKGETLAGVNVLIKGTNNGVATDINGEYSIEVPDANAFLVFSYIGYISQEIAVGNKLLINVLLVVDSETIEEVVVIGYGSKRKETLTGSVTSISNREIQTTTAVSIAQKLQGKVAGLQIRQLGGEPGTFNNMINIRGFGTPLYVIDGVIRGGSSEFQRLNPDDIESISFLKDASAAIYGFGAANYYFS